jgi:transposase
MDISQIPIPDDMKKAVSLYESGMSQSEIAKVISVYPPYISWWLKNLGLKRSRSQAITIAGTRRVDGVFNRKDAQEAKVLYEQGLSTNEISQKLGVKGSTIGYWLRRLGCSRSLQAAQIIRRAKEHDIADLVVSFSGVKEQVIEGFLAGKTQKELASEFNIYLSKIRSWTRGIKRPQDHISWEQKKDQLISNNPKALEAAQLFQAGGYITEIATKLDVTHAVVTQWLLTLGVYESRRKKPLTSELELTIKNLLETQKDLSSYDIAMQLKTSMVHVNRTARKYSLQKDPRKRLSLDKRDALAQKVFLLCESGLSLSETGVELNLKVGQVFNMLRTVQKQKGIVIEKISDSKQRYTQTEDKLEAIKAKELYLSGRTVLDISKMLGISKNNIRRWIYKLGIARTPQENKILKKSRRESLTLQAS